VVVENKQEKFSTNEQMYLHLLKFSFFSGIMLLAFALVGAGLYIYVAITALTTLNSAKDDPLFWFYIGIMALSVILLVMFSFRKRQMFTILDQYIRQNYFLVFQMQKPEGKDFKEKFMSLAEQVFPSIKREIRRGKTWQEAKLGGYSFDISMKTHEGVFLLKRFTDQVKFEDIEKIVKVVNKHKPKRGILRVVCLAKNFDDMFFSDELDTKMESLVHKIVKFKTLLSRGKAEYRLSLDLIVERENGYSILWLT